MLSAKPPSPPNTAPEKLLPPPTGTRFLGCWREYISIWLPALFSSLLSLYTTRDDARGGNQDGCNWDAMGTGRKGARSCRTSRGQRCGEGRRRIRGGAERGEQERALNNFISRTRAAGRPLRTAGLWLGCCCAALWLMRHLLRLTVCICCRSPPPAKLPAAAAPVLALPRSQVRPATATCAAPGIPRAASRHATERG